jgi:RNA polymerase sigma-70 factor, ECF subfamily
MAKDGTTAEVSDTKLMEGIARKDQRAFSFLYDRYSAVLFAAILNIVRTRAEAEDVLQEVFMEAWNGASKFDREKKVAYGWLMTIARNRAIDRTRAKSFSSRASEDLLANVEDAGESPLNAQMASERKASVKKALEALPEEQRILISTCYFDGLSQQAASDRFGIPLGTVKTRMRLGLAKLSALLHGGGMQNG